MDQIPTGAFPRRRPSSSPHPAVTAMAAVAAALVLATAIGAGLGLATGTAARAATIYRYVATTGSDYWTGSSTRPWRTIRHAVKVVPAGTTIIVRSGTYSSFAVTRPSLTVRSATGARVVVSGGTYPVLVRGTSRVTIRGLIIRGAPKLWGSGVRVESSSSVVIERNVIRDNHSFGIKVKNATRVTIRYNEITKNDTGIELSGAVGGTNVRSNRIHHNDRMVTSSRGGNAIVFSLTTGAVTVSGNQIWGNRARHLDGIGYDGGAFEVYGASDLLISGNIVWDNNNVMETGTDGTAPCSRIRFVRNVAMGKGTVAGETQGMILRCASDSLVAHNTFDGLDQFAFYVTESGSHAGGIGGLRVVDNIVVRGRAWSLAAGLPAGLDFDYNLVFPGGSTATYADRVAYVEGRGNTSSLAEFRSWTGYEAHGLQGDPRFVDRAAGDYHLRAGSPAIDAGVTVLSDPVIGSAADIGRYEYAP